MADRVRYIMDRMAVMLKLLEDLKIFSSVSISCLNRTFFIADS
jgi:hypothetical protein